MSRAWMPLYIGDYLADTQHLTTTQHGAYILLIMHYWQHNGLPQEDEAIARISRLNRDQWKSNCQAIAKLFLPGWKHKRVDRELEKHRIISEKRQMSGRIGGLRRGNKSSMPRIISEAFAKQTGNQSQSPITTTFTVAEELHVNGAAATALPTGAPPREPVTKRTGNGSLEASPSLTKSMKEKGWTT